MSINVEFFSYLNNLPLAQKFKDMTPTIIGFTGVFFDEEWGDDGFKVIPVIATTSIYMDEFDLNCSCNANIIISSDNTFDFVCFDQDPTSVNNNLWFSGLTSEGIEDLEGFENSIKLIGLFPLLKHTQNLPALQDSAMEELSTKFKGISYKQKPLAKVG